MLDAKLIQAKNFKEIIGQEWYLYPKKSHQKSSLGPNQLYQVICYQCLLQRTEELSFTWKRVTENLKS